jgi:RNA polymerase sigma-70 factor (ECF subfamily)
LVPGADQAGRPYPLSLPIVQDSEEGGARLAADAIAQRALEAELLVKASRGDEAAFLVLYERHRTPVFRFACRLLGSAPLAEDVTHDCFVSVMRKPLLFQPELASLRTYLCAAARNLAFKQLRRQGIETTVEETPEPSPVRATPEPLQRVIDSEVADHVREAVEALPPLQREAVILFEYHEMSLADIAFVSKTDVGTIKSRLHRARQRLKRTLAPWYAAAASGRTQEKTHD